MASPRSCSNISDREITRGIISYLEGMPKGTQVTTRQLITGLGQQLDCDPGAKGSKQYERIKERIGKAFPLFHARDTDPAAWNAFKQKYVKKGAVAVPLDLPAPLPAVAAPVPGGLASLAAKDLAKLGDLCRANKTKVEIEKALSKLGVTRVAGKAPSKLRKGELCDAVLAFAPAPAPLPAAAAIIAPGPRIDRERCDTRANTIEQLKTYIASRGWPAPPSKATKAKICSYIESMEAKAPAPAPPVVPPAAAILAAPPAPGVPTGGVGDVPPGYDDCANPRGSLTKPKIKNWVMTKGWHKEPGFPGFPADKKDKGTWCSFLAELINAHPIGGAAPAPEAPEAPVAPQAPEAPAAPPASTCYESGEWKRVEDVEQELAACPPGQVCNISKRTCVSEEEAKERGWELLEIKLKSGRVVPVYSDVPGALTKLRPLLRDYVAKPTPPKPKKRVEPCGTLTEGTREDLIDNLACPAEQVCDLAARQCAPLAPGMIKLTLGGKEVVGPAERIEELRRQLGEPAPAPIPAPVPGPKAKPKVVFKPGKVVYGEAEQKRQAEAAAILAQLIGEPVAPGPPKPVPPTPAPPVIAPPEPKPAPPIEPPVAPAAVPIPVIEEPSAVARLMGRLKDIRAQPAQPPVKLLRAESELSKAIGACVGIQS